MGQLVLGFRSIESLLAFDTIRLRCVLGSVSENGISGSCFGVTVRLLKYLL